MANLADEISRLTKTAPSWADPEDISDGAKLLERDETLEKSEDVTNQPSFLRKRAAVFDDDDDGRYQGKKISRKKLGIELVEKQDGSEEQDNREASSDSDDNLETNESFMYNDEDGSGMSGSETSGSDEDGDSDEDQSHFESSMEVDNEDAGIDKLSSVKQDDKQKALAVQHQLNFWESLLKLRIEMQKVMNKVNQLPQPENWRNFQVHGGQEYSQLQQKAKHNMVRVLQELVQLQTASMYQNTDTRPIAAEGEVAVKKDDDEEIASDSETEDEPVSKPTQQIKLSAYPEFITKRHKRFSKFRDDTIQKWYDKTRVSGGKLNKGFTAFDQSALKQINQILSDKERLVKRTQLKRSSYKILGEKRETAEENVADADDQADASLPNRDHLKEYNNEIFDDNDFYHQILREIIESKSRDINDPIAISRHWLEIQKLRSKAKRKVDTRASKGRKIRYEVHPKMVNFMAAVETSSWTDEAKNDLYASLFGKQL